MKKHRFSIVIVTWNAAALLKEFLPSVAGTDYDNFEIVVADNASTDGSRSWIEENLPGCKIITFRENYGYCGGNNRAVKYCTGDVIVFLNNDVKTDKHWLTHLDKAFSDPETGIVQPKMLSVTRPDYFEYAGAAGGFIDWLGYPFCRGRIIEEVEKDRGQYDRPVQIFWASGAALAIRKELFEELGGFDEDFEFHMEEIDLCWRGWRYGTKVKFEPESIVYHLGGGSMPMGSPRKVYYNYRNSLIMLTKNLERYVLPKIFFRAVLDGISGIRSLLLGRPGETLAIIRSHFAFYRMLPGTLRKRRHIKRNSNQPLPQNVVYRKLIVFDAFIRGRKTFSEIDHPEFE